MNRQIGIVGCGIIGSSWAAVFLAAGRNVVVWDPILSAEEIRSRVENHFQKGGLESARKGRLMIATEVDDLTVNTEYIQESIAEEITAKQELFAQLDAVCPLSTILATSSSAIPVSQIASNLAGKERMVVAHPAAPPHAMPAVEVVPAPFTSKETLRRTWCLLEDVGQVPVHILREVKGFAMNRMQAVLLFSMLEMISDGIVTPEGADDIIRESFGMRWSILGPFEGVHLNAPGGIRDYFTRYKQMFAAMCPKGKSIDTLLSSENLNQLENYALRTASIDQITERRAWRDSRLIEMKQWKQEGGWNG